MGTGTDGEFRQAVRADLYRYTRSPGWKGFWKGMEYPGFRFTYVLRQALRHSKFSLPGLLFRFLYWHYFWRYQYQIPLSTEIGGGLYIGHFGAIVVNSQARIGRNCNLAPGVTIGQANRGPRRGNPRIGDRVWIGTNAVIVGNVHVGNNVLIAPGAFVNFDVPDDSIVLGNPGRIIPRPDATEGYIENVLGEAAGNARTAVAAASD
jgi:serine O-acetyltransferase